jgi:hypothetical protein
MAWYRKITLHTKEQPMRYSIGRASIHAWTLLLVFAFATHLCGAGAPPHDSPSGSEQTLQEVTVTAARVQDQRALARAVSGFVTSHAAPGTRINQIGRWHEPVCPLVSGLQPPGQDYITRKILDVARAVGAPTGSAGRKCAATVEIVFTREPQALLDRIAKAYRPLLGFYPASQVKQTTTFSRPIQAWYVTGTRSMDAMPDASHGNAPETGITQLPEQRGGSIVDMPLLSGVQVDSDVTAMGLQPSGVGGSYLSNGQRSEFLHVLIIADSGQIAHYAVHSIADYLALLSLTRMAQLDSCAPLPSITDLFASGCATPVADSLTGADRAYLKALYMADLEKNLNIERADIHSQMMREIEER